MTCEGETNGVVTKTQTVSQFSYLYKTPGTLFSQCERRSKLLQEIKERRNNAIDEFRGLSDLFTEDICGEEPMDIVIRHAKSKKKRIVQKIMLSEWLTEVPADLEENWIVKLCPVGVRNIIICHNGITKVYNRHQQMKAVFESDLPGGGPTTNGERFTILDCIYNGKNRTYYILDVLVWNSCSLLKCSVDFRFFFLRSKMAECFELPIKSNTFNFEHLDYIPAELPLIEKLLSVPYVVNEIELPLDGVLFYHKDGIYRTGITPLVVWLKPYMIPEVLEIPVHESYLLEKPKNYTTFEKHLEYVNKKRKKSKRTSSTGESVSGMETDEDSSSNVMETN